MEKGEGREETGEGIDMVMMRPDYLLHGFVAVLLTLVWLASFE